MLKKQSATFKMTICHISSDCNKQLRGSLFLSTALLEDGAGVGGGLAERQRQEVTKNTQDLCLGKKLHPLACVECIREEQPCVGALAHKNYSVSHSVPGDRGFIIRPPCFFQTSY